jgi:cysteine synthase B
MSQSTDTAIDEARIGRTPLVELDVDVPATVCAKVEWFNLPEAAHGGGSIKSRIAKGMLDGAEERGDLTPDRTVIEPTSGNTGSELARLATARGYDVEIVMPDNASGGKIEAVRDTGAEIHFVDADEGYDAVIERCEELVAADPERYYRPNQYENPDNPGAHEETTAPEIWDQTDGEVTHFIAGVGTGGTITGTGRGLHAKGDVTVVGFEPANPLHAIDGLKYLRTGNHYHPTTYDESVLDAKLYVDTSDAYDRARELRERYMEADPRVVDTGQYDAEFVADHLRVEGQFVVGTSAGAGVRAAEQLHEEHGVTEDDTVVIMLCDRGDKYADIPLWEEYLSVEA